MIKAVIFDCFGVLYIDAHKSLAEQYPEASQELSELRRRADYGLLNRQEYIQAMASATGLDGQAIEQQIQQEHALNAPLVEYIKDELKAHYKIGMLSNIGRGWVQDFFSEHDLHDFFSAVVLSGEQRCVKPDPKIYELMANRMSLQTSECIMIDDILANCEGAKQAGMQAIHYTGLKETKQQLKQFLALQ